MKTHDVLVLGGGMIGSAVAFDLARSGRARVTIADLREPALPLVRGRSDVAVRRADLSDPDAVRTLAEGFDVVVGALPSVLGHAALRAVIEAGTDVVDISFMRGERARRSTAWPASGASPPSSTAASPPASAT